MRPSLLVTKGIVTNGAMFATNGAPGLTSNKKLLVASMIYLRKLSWLLEIHLDTLKRSYGTQVAVWNPGRQTVFPFSNAGPVVFRVCVSFSGVGVGEPGTRWENQGLSLRIFSGTVSFLRSRSTFSGSSRNISRNQSDTWDLMGKDPRFVIYCMVMHGCFLDGHMT